MPEFPSLPRLNYTPIHLWFIHSSAEGPLGCFQLWAIVSKTAAVNVGIQISLYIPIFPLLGVSPGVALLDCTVNQFLMFCGAGTQLPHCTSPPALHEGSNSSTSWLTLVFLLFLIKAIPRDVKWYLYCIFLYLFTLKNFILYF